MIIIAEIISSTWFDRACPERAVHPSRTSGRTASRRAHHERNKVNDFILTTVRPEP